MVEQDVGQRRVGEQLLGREIERLQRRLERGIGWSKDRERAFALESLGQAGSLDGGNERAELPGFDGEIEHAHIDRLFRHRRRGVSELSSEHAATTSASATAMAVIENRFFMGSPFPVGR